jgi:hypothetical protein
VDQKTKKADTGIGLLVFKRHHSLRTAKLPFFFARTIKVFAIPCLQGATTHTGKMSGLAERRTILHTGVIVAVTLWAKRIGVNLVALHIS